MFQKVLYLAVFSFVSIVLEGPAYSSESVRVRLSMPSNDVDALMKIGFETGQTERFEIRGSEYEFAVIRVNEKATCYRKTRVVSRNFFPGFRVISQDVDFCEIEVVSDSGR